MTVLLLHYLYAFFEIVCIFGYIFICCQQLLIDYLMICNMHDFFYVQYMQKYNFMKDIILDVHKLRTHRMVSIKSGHR